MNKKEAKAELEKIRKESRSIEELLGRAGKVWKSLGITVVFTNYPSCYSEKVSNSHNSPKGYKQNWTRNDKLPYGYPGWTGRWEGYITIDRDISILSKVGFTELIRGVGIGGCSCNWLKTGIGSSGVNFRIDGMLFLYDFPAMHQQFKNKGEDFALLKKEHANTITAYWNDFVKYRRKYIKSTTTIKNILKYREMLMALDAELYLKETAATLCLRDQFNSKYAKTPPTNNFCIDPDELNKNIFLATQQDDTKVMPELSEIFERIQQLSNDIERYATEKPEVLI